MIDKDHEIKSKLKAFRRKYYLNLAFRGLLIFLCLTLSIFLVVNTLEYSFHFGKLIRAMLLFSFVMAAVYLFCRYVIVPLYKFVNKKRGMNDEEAATKIGSAFPEVGDKLLNIVQLNKLQSSLAKAGVAQKTETIKHYSFEDAVDVNRNRQYFKYLIAPVAVIIILLILAPSFITSSSSRIIRFNREFVPEPPFSFNLVNKELLAFKNEDFKITLQLKGKAIPENVYLINNERKIKLTRTGPGEFSYTFTKIQHHQQFRFEAAGFYSPSYRITAVSRPNLRNFNVFLDYPQYLNKQNERLNNVGNLQIPEGTSVKWQLKTLDAEEAVISFQSSEQEYELEPIDNQLFMFERSFKRSQIYNINLKNKYSENKEKIQYKIEVIPDQYPQINVNVFEDTTLYSFVVLAGNISDDYGLTKLQLLYQIAEAGKQAEFKPIDIPLTSRRNSQSYYYQWPLDSLDLDVGSTLKYYLRVWDNDGVNGRKASKTGTYTFRIPSRKEIKEEIAKASSKSEQNIDKTADQAQQLREKIEKAGRKLKGQQNLSWQDENMLKEIVKKREELSKAIEELKKQNLNNVRKRERFSEQNERIREKAEQLQKLMDELLDEETKRLYEELQKLLEEKSEIEDIQNILDKLNYKESNLEKELERTLELFKRMKFDYKLNEAINAIDEQIKEQDKLTEESLDKNNDKEDLAAEQEELQEEFKEFREELDALEEMNQELKNPESLPDMQEKEKTIQEEQQKAKEALEKNKRKKAGESQQKARQQMQQMSKQMQQMQSSMEMVMMQENLDALRDIVHNLLKLSFDQEKLMTQFVEIDQSDPRFIEVAQQQLKLKNDAQIVEDSLLSLANRVFQIASFVTREVGEMNEHMDKSMGAIRDRKKPLAASEQQFAMTSMNNLALLLDDVLQQMQNAMSQAMGQPGKGKGKDKPLSLSELQQKLNQKISELKRSGKTGRELSEALAKLAAEQQRIRRALEEEQEKIGKGENGLKPGEGIPEKMEETETDLVNKRITAETIKRQQEILTRLLEAEDAMRERELDDEREAETARDYEKILPKAFEEYFKMKQKEIELLRTLPPKLYPYYKKEVNEYFKRLGKEPNN